MNAITYSLSRDIGPYYRELSQLTDRVLEKATLLLPSTSEFEDFIARDQLETVRASSLHRLELLSLAHYWHNYGATALAAPKAVTALCRRLVFERDRKPAYKRRIDTVRGILNKTHLTPASIAASSTNVTRFVLDFERMDTLLLWLEATGEFKEESRRFRVWQRFLESLPRYQARAFFRGAAVLAHWFKEAAATVLGKYTGNVERFRRSLQTQHQNREDVVLRARERSDYHLIMVGAEIMNRALAPAFSSTKKRIALLPGCMRPQHHPCKASGVGYELECRRCSSACPIGRIADRADGAFEVRVIVHASDFTVLLKKWANQSEIGLIASACVLHLFTGGYEMMALDIPAQCVFLDHAGCKKHWHDQGISTAVDEDRLFDVASKTLGHSPPGHRNGCPASCRHCA